MSPIGCEDDSETSSRAIKEERNKAGLASETPCQVPEMNVDDGEEEVFIQELDPGLAQPLPNAVLPSQRNSSGSTGHPTVPSAAENNHLSVDVANSTSQPIHKSTGEKGQSVSNTFIVGRMGSLWRGKTTVTKAMRQMKKVSRVPAFIPGRVLLIEEKQSTARRYRLVIFISDMLGGWSVVDYTSIA